MSGAPDFARSVSYQGELLAEWNSDLIGAGSDTVGPFGSSGFSNLVLGLQPTNGDIDIFVGVNVDGTTRFPFPTWDISCRSGNDLYAILPIYGDQIDEITITGDAAPCRITGYVFGTNRPVYCGYEALDGIVYADDVIPVAAAATVDIYPQTTWGNVECFFNLPGGNWALVINAEDRTGAVMANIDNQAAATGAFIERYIFPPRIVHIALTNNTGGNQNASLSIRNNPYGL